MRQAAYVAALGVIFLFSACTGKQEWNDAHEEEFVSNCKSSFISSFEASMAGKMDMVDEGALEKVADKYCNCSFQAIKKQYKSPDEALEKSTDELLQSASDCEPTPEDISGLLK